jgi:hypothetical protein
MKQVLVSIHDVSPQSLPQVDTILKQLSQLQYSNIILLIIPGKQWKAKDINRLKKYQRSGYILAGHGVFHQCQSIQTITHRLHSLLISRNAAEHLSLTINQISVLISSCYHWFLKNGFDAPCLYVPPAWAMGKVPRKELIKLPFRFYESLTGMYDSQTDNFYYMPLLGFEADTIPRKWAVRMFNTMNCHYAKIFDKTIRIAIHPNDFQLLLAQDLEKVLNGRIGSQTLNCELATKGPTPITQFKIQQV